MIKFENLIMYYLIQSLNSYLYLMFPILDISIFPINIQNTRFIFLNLSMIIKNRFPYFYSMIYWFNK